MAMEEISRKTQMIKCKGTGLVDVRKIMQSKFPHLKKPLLDKLGAEDERTYRLAMEASWVDLDAVARIYTKAAGIMYPGDPDGLYKIGEAQAQSQLTGIYRFIMKMITVSYLIEKTAQLWKIYYDRGHAWTEQEPGQTKAIMRVEGFPELPRANCESTRGYIAGAIALTGVQAFQVKGDYARPQCWRWLIEWV